MKKLNNKGVTIVEILVVFILVSVITISMYQTILTFKEKKDIEEMKEEILTYKNLVTQDIQSDLTKKGLVDAQVYVGGASELQSKGLLSSTDINGKAYNCEYQGDNNTNCAIYIAILKFRDGSVKKLQIKQQLAKGIDEFDYNDEETLASEQDSGYEATGLEEGEGETGNVTDENTNLKGIDDSFEVLYGTYIYTSDQEQREKYYMDRAENYTPTYLGYSRNEYGNKVLDLRLINVDLSVVSNTLTIYMGLYYPDLGDRYSIDIVAPIQFTTASYTEYFYTDNKAKQTYIIPKSGTYKLRACSYGTTNNKGGCAEGYKYFNEKDTLAIKLGTSAKDNATTITYNIQNLINATIGNPTCTNLDNKKTEKKINDGNGWASITYVSDSNNSKGEDMLSIYQDMNNWSSLFPDRATITYNSNMNQITLKTAGGWENIYTKLFVTKNKKYILTFDYSIQTSYSTLSKAYNGIGVQILNAIPTNTNCQSSQIEVKYLPTGINQGKIDIKFTAQETTYINFNFGMAKDGQNLNLKLGNFKLTQNY